MDTLPKYNPVVQRKTYGIYAKSTMSVVPYSNYGKKKAT